MGGLMLTFEDVTDKLTLEREYNTLIAVQRASLDNLYEGVAVFGEDGTLKLSNPILQHMWGLSDEFLSTEPHIADVVEVAKPYLETDRDWPRLKQALVGRVTGRMTRTGRFTRKDGMVVAYGVVPLPDGGVLTSFRDMTDTMRVERALRERNDALEAADRLKSEFVANISYELRTPLNTIIGFTEILNNQYFGALNERQAEYAEGILEASHRLLALINDILDLAVIEAGRMILEIEELNVRDLLDSVVNLTSEWAREQDLALQMQCPDTIGTIEGDERRLKHALFNLISNAIKFTPPGGRIAIGAKRTGDKVAITVADSGIGISADDQDAVFEKFVRGRGPDGRQLGAGLGLSLVKSFIALHGGQMALDSMPERGTRVTVWLPVKQLKVEPEDAEPGAEESALESLAGAKKTAAAE
jgi:signal transduction histidine kinase